MKIIWNRLGEDYLHSGIVKAAPKFAPVQEAVISLPVNAAVWLEERSEFVKKQAQIMDRIYKRTDAKQN